jgi:hypothetical protein
VVAEDSTVGVVADIPVSEMVVEVSCEAEVALICSVAGAVVGCSALNAVLEFCIPDAVVDTPVVAAVLESWLTDTVVET